MLKQVTLQYRLRLVAIDLIQYFSSSFFAMDFAMSTHCSRESISDLNRYWLNLRYNRTKGTFSTAQQSEVTSNKVKDTVSEILWNCKEEIFSTFSADVIDRVFGLHAQSIVHRAGGISFWAVKCQCILNIPISKNQGVIALKSSCCLQGSS